MVGFLASLGWTDSLLSLVAGDCSTCMDEVEVFVVVDSLVRVVDGPDDATEFDEQNVFESDLAFWSVFGW